MPSVQIELVQVSEDDRRALPPGGARYRLQQRFAAGEPLFQRSDGGIIELGIVHCRSHKPVTEMSNRMAVAPISASVDPTCVVFVGTDSDRSISDWRMSRKRVRVLFVPGGLIQSPSGHPCRLVVHVEQALQIHDESRAQAEIKAFVRQQVPTARAE